MKITLISCIAIMLCLLACNPSKKITVANAEHIVHDSASVSLPIIAGKTSPFLINLLNEYPQFFDSILKNKDHNVQIIYTKIDRGRNGNPKLTDYFYGVNEDEYFYPASTVKLPVAILALQKLNELNIQGLNRKTTMITETAFDKQTAAYNDPNSADGRPTIENYIKKIFLVSDNDAFNRLYEFLGQEYINNRLHKMGFDDVQLIHRLSIAMNEEQNRNTNPVKFYDENSKLIYEKPAERSNLVYEQRNTKKGIGYFSSDKLINEPFDFSLKNKIGLESLHGILESVLFPGAVSKKQRFNLTDEDYRFLYKYMSMQPAESRYPVYDSVHYPENYGKFILTGSEKIKADDWDIRIFNKIGEAYGYLTDVAYIVDFKNNIEFMVTATISCNSDGIYNDDTYDYDSVGLPFLKNLGQVIYQYELKRERKISPDLSSFKFNYSE
jgi:hypothetical protein